MQMAPRLWRRRDDVPEATCDVLRELCAAYAPTLVFDGDEHFFPILAEAYLAHTSYGPWPTGTIQQSALDDLVASDAHHRGTALIRVEGSVDDITHVAGPPNAHGRHLQFNGTSTDAEALGRPDRTGPTSGDLHLVAGGWLDDARDAGDEQYLGDLFSELADAMNPEDGRAWSDPARANLGTLWVQQPVNPTTYAEVDWVGAKTDLAAAGDLPDFAPALDGEPIDRLDGFLQVTYHYLFPVRRPADPAALGLDTVARLEGQWQAVTLYFEVVEQTGTNPETGRPEQVWFAEPPRHVALSNQLDAERRADVHEWEDVEKFQITVPPALSTVAAVPSDEQFADSTSAVIYVGRGTHAFFIQPVDGNSPYDQDPPAPSEDIDEEDFTDEWGVGGFFLALLVMLLVIVVLVGLGILVGALAGFLLGLAGALALIGAALAIIAVIAIAVLVILAIIAMFAWLEDWFDSDGDAPHQHQGNEESNPSGSAGEPPPTSSDGTPGPSEDSVANGGTVDPDETTERDDSVTSSGTYASGTGAPDGHDAAPFDVRVIDNLHRHIATGFPPDPGTCELPHWWDYRGSWGVPVYTSEARRWRSGMPRRDVEGRDWGYWHAVELDVHLHG